MLLPRTFLPSHDENRMRDEGDVEAARARFLRDRPPNLERLLRGRFEWMNAYLADKKDVVELGAGPAFSKEFITNPHFKTTDVAKRPWIDLEVDALNLPFAEESMDAVVCSHMIHHLAHPISFFRSVARVLRPGGLALIVDINTSFLMRSLLYAMRHEGWSYDVDVFDEETVANNPEDPWSANCAIPQLLFADPERFERAVPGLRVVRNDVFEGLIFPLSGGVISKTRTLQLPKLALDLVEWVDRRATRALPDIFALGRRVVLEKGR